MARNGLIWLKWLEMAGDGQNGWKQLNMDGNGWNSRNGWKWQRLQEMLKL